MGRSIEDLERILSGKDADKFIRLTNAGVPLRQACEASGFVWRTVFRWITHGRDGTEPYVEFARRYDEARGTYASALVMKINKGSDKDWKAAAWMLERQFKKEFGDEKKRPEDENDLSVGEIIAGLRTLDKIRAASAEKSAADVSEDD